MQISCSLNGFVDTLRPNEGINNIFFSGFNDVFLDLSAFFTPNDLEKTKSCKYDKFISSVNGFLSKAQGKFKFDIAIAPYLQSDTKRNDDFIKTLAYESIKLSAEAGCKYIIIRPLFSGFNDDDIYNVNNEYHLSLAKIAKKYNIKILLQNQCKNLNGHFVRGLYSNPYQTAQIIASLNESCDIFGFCLDMGACTLCGQDVAEFIKPLEKYIKAVIMRDSEKHRESSLLPFTNAGGGSSSTDWLGLVRALRKFNFDGNLIFDIKDTAQSFSPMLRPNLLTFTKTIADYFVFQIELENKLKKYKSIVLFGAGNMCRSYMKCYGDIFKPLFTCDNNKTLWGSIFCDLEVKSPQELTQLDKNTVILICNIYYKEITEQLRQMGIKNDIEYFSDDFLPQYHFTAIERR